MEKLLKEKIKLADVANFVAAICLFLSPWALHFANQPAPAWNAWASAVVIALLAVTALWRSGAWATGGDGAIGIWVAASPWLLGFADNSNATWAHVALGALVVAASALGLTWPRISRRKLV